MRSYVGLLALMALGTACSPYQPIDEDKRPISQAYVHKYGVETDSRDWNERGGSGQVITTQKNGVTVTRNYVTGVLQGETTYTFPLSTDIEKRAIYENGELLSETSYFPSGNKRMGMEYNPVRPEDLIITQWYENGTERSREAFINDRLDEGKYFNHQGELETTVSQGSGIRMERDDLGQLISSDIYKHGELVESTFYHPNRSLKEVIPYVAGNIDGIRKFYNIGGDPDRFEEWKQGHQTGITTQFKNGEKYAEVPFEDGMRVGIEKRFRDGEFVVEEVTWVNGRRHGPSTAYIGQEIAVDWYFHDKRVSKTQFDKLTTPHMN